MYYIFFLITYRETDFCFRLYCEFFPWYPNILNFQQWHLVIGAILSAAYKVIFRLDLACLIDCSNVNDRNIRQIHFSSSSAIIISGFHSFICSFELRGNKNQQFWHWCEFCLSLLPRISVWIGPRHSKWF